MRTTSLLASPILPGTISGLVYFVIAVATGASAVGAIVGGLVVALIAVGIGFMVRSFYVRRAASHGKS